LAAAGGVSRVLRNGPVDRFAPANARSASEGPEQNGMGGVSAGLNFGPFDAYFAGP